MAWPTGNVSLANVDADSDSITSARPQIYQALANINEIREFGVNITDNQTIAGDKTFTGNTTLNEYREFVHTQGNVSGTFAPNAYAGPVQTITATGNITLSVPTGMDTGSSIVLIIRQDGTGSRRLTANSSYKFAGNFRTLSTSANSTDTLSVFYDGSAYLCNLTTGYA